MLLVYSAEIRPPLIDCLFPVRRPRLLLPAASHPFFSQVRHMRMRKSIKRYVTVLEHTNPHQDVQLFRTIFATVDLYYPTRSFRCDICSNDWKNCEDFAKLNNNNNRPPACIQPRLWDRKQPIKYSWPKRTRHTERQTHRPTKYSNPRCACASRVNEFVKQDCDNPRKIGKLSGCDIQWSLILRFNRFRLVERILVLHH